LNGSDVTVGSSTALSTVFTGFDSTTIWNINSSLNTIAGGALPTLKTNPQTPAPTLPGTAASSTLSGNITISPNSGATTGTQLTANYTGSESVTYQWQKDGVNIGTNSSTFTPTEAGSYTVTVSAAGYTSKTSTAVTVTLAAAGTAGNPFLVSNETELRKVGTETTTGGWTKAAHYRQTANIAMTGGNFTPIGTNASRFTGSYNGDGKTITGLSITVTTGYTGLFGYIGAGGTVKNMNVTGTVTTTANDRTGGIAGANEGTIDNCVFNGTVRGNTSGSTTSDWVGGIVGRNNGTVINSRNNATVTGGLQVGGIAGTAAELSKIENSYNTGSVTGVNSIGGIVGNNTGATNYIKNCYNTGNVTATIATDAVVGGIAGYNSNNALIEYCYNTGNISGTSSNGTCGVGGILGYNTTGSTTVRNCVSLGAKVTDSSINKGRVAGSNYGTLSNKARADMKIGANGSEAIPTTNIGATLINGESVAVNTAQTSVFSGWDTTIWNIITTGNLSSSVLPTLKTNPQSPNPTLPASP
jgi:hypothetical protein